MLLSMEEVYYLDLRGEVSSIAEQLAIEEALLRTDNRNWCLVRQGSSPTIVLGISGEPEELVHQKKAKEMGVPLLKRYSGGGTVVVDCNTLFVSFIGNHSWLPCAPFPRKIMEWTESFYASIAPFSLCDHDYVIGNKKVGGNAQSITKDRFVHHTTFLWDYCPDLMELLKQPSRQPAYRQERDHTEFLTTLSPFLSSQEKFFHEIRKSFQAVPSDVDFEELLSRPHRRATRWITNEKEAQNAHSN